ncbi:uncharacterized protein CLUP02_07666 [Colletotrichum lupini]|uniref:Uncharacterized protein n=1 Tax=Colletotrichum lupini TaxID=145971 RepID=A0A9Q8SSB8_9PEZI|nr:uncharacterized protein CLUP02_07666 [Colletotrichum lupini]UQC82180.1 hypothetical protein CLUP02_07666 [Colletotrichum lupini]
MPESTGPSLEAEPSRAINNGARMRAVEMLMQRASDTGREFLLRPPKRMETLSSVSPHLPRKVRPFWRKARHILRVSCSASVPGRGSCFATHGVWRCVGRESQDGEDEKDRRHYLYRVPIAGSDLEPGPDDARSHPLPHAYAASFEPQNTWKGWTDSDNQSLRMCSLSIGVQVVDGCRAIRFNASIGRDAAKPTIESERYSGTCRSPFWPPACWDRPPFCRVWSLLGRCMFLLPHLSLNGHWAQESSPASTGQGTAATSRAMIHGGCDGAPPISSPDGPTAARGVAAVCSHSGVGERRGNETGLAGLAGLDLDWEIRMHEVRRRTQEPVNNAYSHARTRCTIIRVKTPTQSGVRIEARWASSLRETGRMEEAKSSYAGEGEEETKWKRERSLGQVPFIGGSHWPLVAGGVAHTSSPGPRLRPPPTSVVQTSSVHIHVQSAASTGLVPHPFVDTEHCTCRRGENGTWSGKSKSKSCPKPYLPKRGGGKRLQEHFTTRKYQTGLNLSLFASVRKKVHTAPIHPSPSYALAHDHPADRTHHWLLSRRCTPHVPRPTSGLSSPLSSKAPPFHTSPQLDSPHTLVPRPPATHTPHSSPDPGAVHPDQTSSQRVSSKKGTPGTKASPWGKEQGGLAPVPSIFCLTAHSIPSLSFHSTIPITIQLHLVPHLRVSVNQTILDIPITCWTRLIPRLPHLENIRPP